MGQKIFTALFLVIFSLLFIPFLLTKAVSPRSNIWPEISSHIRIDYKMGQQAEVDKQIDWYLDHPKVLHALLSNAQPYLYYVYQQIQQRNLPAELALIPIIESSYNPFAQSAMGASGLWQIMPATGADYGLKTSHNFNGRLDVMSSTKAALSHFSSLYNYFGDWLLAIAAYDAGAGKIKSIMMANQASQQNTDVWSLSLPEEAKFYVTKLIALAAIVKDPERFHVILPPIPNEPFFLAFPLNHQSINLHQIAETTQIDLSTLRRLNPGFSLDTNFIIEGDYALLIPKDKAYLIEENTELTPNLG